MRNLLLFIKRFYPFFLFLLLEIVALVLISRSNTYHHSVFVNSANQFTGNIFERRAKVVDYFDLKKKNDLLQQENALLRDQLSNVKKMADSSQLDTLGAHVYEFIPARVLNHTTEKKYNYFTLNVGRKEGIVKGMGVIDSKGIVGTITNVSKNYAVGLSMLNKNSHTSVMHKKSGAIGLMRWQGNQVLVHVVEDITKTAQVQVGDTITTSGYSTFYPRGLTVGIVTNADLKEGSNFYDIAMHLSNDILSLDQVYLVKHHDKEELDSLEVNVQ